MIARNRVPFLLGLAMALSGCRVTNLNHWRYDTRPIRALQESSLHPFGDRPVAGKSVKAFFEHKVGLITTKGSPIPFGRAVPIHSDGYYLTAWHVVDEGKFVLSNTVMLKPFPKKGSFTFADHARVDEHPGRVVWQDRAADLAIVKFDFAPPAVFKVGGSPLEKGAAVFSGASGRNSGTLFMPERKDGRYNFADGIGNGPFQTAGKVTGVRHLDKGGTFYEATLVSRGGMSGAPVVDGEGRLVGIVSAIQSKLFATPATRFSMIDARTLEAIVAADRDRQ